MTSRGLILRHVLVSISVVGEGSLDVFLSIAEALRRISSVVCDMWWILVNVLTRDSWAKTGHIVNLNFLLSHICWQGKTGCHM